MAEFDCTSSPARGSIRSVARKALVGAGVVGLAVALSACGGDKKTEAEVKTAPQATAPAVAGTVTVADQWVKIPKEGMKMTGAFGILKNNSDAPVTVTAVTSPVSSVMELHEVAMVDGTSTMREKQGGFEIPAKGSYELKPGADHIMLMDITTPIKAGDKVAFTLTIKNGKGETEAMTFDAVAKPFAGANESYSPEHGGAKSPASHG